MRPRFEPLLLFAIGGAYVALGWLALHVTVPSGYVTPFYPAAGLAMASILIFGQKVGVAVFCGALITNALSSMHADMNLHGVVPLSALGAWLQAAVGAILVRRIIGYPHAFDTARSIAILLFLIVPLSSLINATVSVPALGHQGLINANELFFNWWSWWLGDTLGALLMIPLMLVFFAQPRSVWRPRRLIVALPIALTMLLTGWIFSILEHSERSRIAVRFEQEARQIALLLQDRLDDQIETLLALQRFVATHNGEFDALTFRYFVTPFLQRNPGTQNFTWNPLVPHSRRGEFERMASEALDTDYRILMRDETAHGRTSVARSDARYLPILYLAPEEGNRSILGLDPQHIEGPRSAIESTLTHRTPGISDSFVLTQETEGQRGVVAYQAVHEPGAEGELLGIVSSAFRMDELIGKSALSSFDHLELCLLEHSDNGTQRLAGPHGCASDQWQPEHLGTAFSVTFGQRQWQGSLRATAGYAAENRSLSSWLSLAVGVLVAGVLGAFLLLTSGLARRTAALVDQRTAELKAATDALDQAQRIARMGSWEMDMHSGRVHCSPWLLELLSLPRRETLSTASLQHAIAPSDRSLFERSYQSLCAHPGTLSFDCRPSANPGRVIHCVLESECRGQANTVTHLIGTVQDVTESRRAEAEVQQLAHYDSLTNLPNRSQWQARAQVALAGAKRHGDTLAVMFLDLDHFKDINDSLGHRAGDMLLQTVANRLSACLRQEDVLARMGGDEFVLLLPRLKSHDDAAVVAQKMLEELALPVHLEGHELHLSVSIGAAFYPDDGDDVEMLLRQADTAMYSAKASGRAAYRAFNRSMTEQTLQRLAVETDLRRALDEEGQLCLYFQPQFEVESQRIVGAEVLIRWQHPDKGLLKPDAFIAAAESSGLIIALGDRVLKQALQYQRHWQSAGLAQLTLSLNISALQFNRDDFVERVEHILRETGSDAKGIELEITESALMHPTDTLLERLHQLRKLGFRLTLDDFGTGYSSMAYLQRLPISRIKLDRSFVQHLPGRAEDAAIAAATLSMARDLGMEVVAEGVETAAQQQYLQQRGCRIMQGFLFAHPMTAKALAQMLEQAGASA